MHLNKESRQNGCTMLYLSRPRPVDEPGTMRLQVIRAAFLLQQELLHAKQARRVIPLCTPLGIRRVDRWSPQQ